MKKILNIILVILLFSSCENNIPEQSYNEDWFVAFENTNIEGKESVSEIQIPVILADNGRREVVTVDFELTPAEGVIEGTHYELLNESNTLTFEYGVGIEYITIIPIDDLDPKGDKSIQITITSNSKSYTIGLPGPDQNQSTCELTIKDDDCPLDLDLFSGNIEGLEDSPWWKDCPGKYKWTPIEEIEPGKIKYTISGWFYAQTLTSDWAWYGSESEIEFYPSTVIIDVTNPADPRYTMQEEPIFYVPAEDWGCKMKPVDNQPLKIDVCGKYVEIPYTILGSGWAHNYTFTVKFQFD